jgi:Tfp pilus assembly protein PilZ
VKEQRRHPRVAIQSTARCETNEGVVFEGVAMDLSLGGMFIESPDAPAFGTNLTIVLTLPDSATALRLPGVVRWNKPGGFGVQFGLLGAAETHAVGRFVLENR